MNNAVILYVMPFLNTETILCAMIFDYKEQMTGDVLLLFYQADFTTSSDNGHSAKVIPVLRA